MLQIRETIQDACDDDVTAAIMRSREHKPRGDDEQSWNEYIGHADISHEEIAAARIGSTVRQIREKWNEILEKRVEERIKLDRNQLRKLDQREQQVLILLEENVLEGNQLEEKMDSKEGEIMPDVSQQPKEPPLKVRSSTKDAPRETLGKNLPDYPIKHAMQRESKIPQVGSRSNETDQDSIPVTRAEEKDKQRLGKWRAEKNFEEESLAHSQGGIPDGLDLRRPSKERAEKVAKDKKRAELLARIKSSLPDGLDLRRPSKRRAEKVAKDKKRAEHLARIQSSLPDGLDLRRPSKRRAEKVAKDKKRAEHLARIQSSLPDGLDLRRPSKRRAEKVAKDKKRAEHLARIQSSLPDGLDLRRPSKRRAEKVAKDKKRAEHLARIQSSLPDGLDLRRPSKRRAEKVMKDKKRAEHLARIQSSPQMDWIYVDQVLDARSGIRYNLHM